MKMILYNKNTPAAEIEMDQILQASIVHSVKVIDRTLLPKALRENCTAKDLESWLQTRWIDYKGPETDKEMIRDMHLSRHSIGRMKSYRSVHAFLRYFVSTADSYSLHPEKDGYAAFFAENPVFNCLYPIQAKRNAS